jgi:FtsH-binding integral membrane protein
MSILVLIDNEDMRPVMIGYQPISYLVSYSKDRGTNPVTILSLDAIRFGFDFCVLGSIEKEVIMDTAYQNQDNIQEWASSFDETFLSVIKNVYLWMCIGLAVTALVSITLIYTPLFVITIQIVQNTTLFYGLLIGELILVIVLAARIQKISISTARWGFFGYAILNGITLSIIFFIYTASSIALTFITTAGLFGAMTIIGYTTRLDLTKWGSYLIMALIGLIIGSVINIFFASSTLDWILTFFGIALFIGLTIYDTQRIKKMVETALQTNDEDIVARVGLLGALSLYLDFINLFLRMLRVVGKVLRK